MYYKYITTSKATVRSSKVQISYKCHILHLFIYSNINTFYTFYAFIKNVKIIIS